LLFNQRCANLSRRDGVRKSAKNQANVLHAPF
jgi:hypothetical protein